jgi:hypothetical protein
MRRAYLPIPALSTRDQQRFHSLIDQRGPDECWPWLGRRNRRGYGSLHIGKVGYRASRLAYFLANGEDPKELGILHSCDNPPCVNPAHLSPGTQRENMQDAVRRGRMPRGENAPATYLVEAEVREIHALYATGEYSIAEVARMCGAHPGTVAGIVYARNWTHLGLPPLRGVRGAYKIGRPMFRRWGDRA